LFVSEDLYVSSYEAVGYAPAAVYEVSFHDDGVLYFCISDGDIVDARVGAYVGVGADLAVVADDGRALDGCVAVDDSALPIPA